MRALIGGYNDNGRVRRHGRSTGQTCFGPSVQDFGTETFAQPGPELWIPVRERRHGTAHVHRIVEHHRRRRGRLHDPGRRPTYVPTRVLLADQSCWTGVQFQPRRPRRPRRITDTPDQ